MLFSCSDDYFYKSLLSGKFYRFLQAGRRDVDLSCVLHNIHCLPDEEIIFCSILMYIYFIQNVKYFYFSPMSSMFFSECEVPETANCLVSITTGQPSASPHSRRFAHVKLWYFSECAIFTWFDSSHPTFPQSCFLYSRCSKAVEVAHSITGEGQSGSHIAQQDIEDNSNFFFWKKGPPSCVCGRKMACKGANHNHVGFQVCNLWHIFIVSQSNYLSKKNFLWVKWRWFLSNPTQRPNELTDIYTRFALWAMSQPCPGRKWCAATLIRWLQEKVATETDCQAICRNTERCEFYTWFDQTNRVFHNYCFLWSSCDSVSCNCVGCSTGPPECTPQIGEILPSPAPSPALVTVENLSVPTSLLPDTENPGEPQGLLFGLTSTVQVRQAVRATRQSQTVWY